MAEVVARMEAIGSARGEDATVTLAAVIELAVDHRQPLPRVTPSQVAAALAAPRLVPLETTTGGTTGDGHDALATTDRGLEAAEEECGELTATVGRLVLAEPAIVARASLGGRSGHRPHR